MLSLALRVYLGLPSSCIGNTSIRVWQYSTNNCYSSNFIKNGMKTNPQLSIRKYLMMSTPKKSSNESNSSKMGKRSSVGSLLAGCCFSLCKKQKTEPAPTSPTERTSLLGAYSSKKSLDNLEIGVDDLSKSIDESGNFPSLSGGVFVSTTDKLAQRSAKLLSVKADITPVTERAESGELKRETKEPSVKEKPQSSIGSGAMLKKKLPPNYFLALQFTDPEIKERLKKVQDHILRGEPKLLPALVSLKKLHITLFVFRADNNEELEKAKKAMAESAIKVQDLIEKSLSIEISGVSTFRNRVVFADIKENEQKGKLLNLAEIMFATFEEKGFEVRDGRPYNPHLTLFKLSQAPNLAKKGIRKIDTHLYQDYAHTTFGTECIKSIQLLSMCDEKDEKGYYHCISELQF